jgi:hypothetical protein
MLSIQMYLVSREGRDALLLALLRDGRVLVNGLLVRLNQSESKSENK